MQPGSHSDPLVTVIALCYNHERFAVECLDSIRNQSYPGIQLIIIDDCSRDRSADIIEDWIRRHRMECTFLRHEANVGICKSINEGVRIAHGKYVAVVATDDVWLPNKVASQVEILEAGPGNIGVLHGDALAIDEHGTPGNNL